MDEQKAQEIAAVAQKTIDRVKTARLDGKTTTTGLIAGGCKIAGMFFPVVLPFCDPIEGVALILMGYFAADRTITASVTDKEQTIPKGGTMRSLLLPFLLLLTVVACDKLKDVKAGRAGDRGVVICDAKDQDCLNKMDGLK